MSEAAATRVPISAPVPVPESGSQPTSYKPRVLVIAGSDSSGGAGIEADQRVLALHSSYALSIITALTAQNTRGVSRIHAIPSSFVTEALHTVWDDISCIRVVKIGMLANASTVNAVSEFLAAKVADASERGERLDIVLDPVMKATTGADLLGDGNAVQLLRTKLLPLASIVTPNLPEAMLLTSSTSPPKTRADLIDLARKVLRLCGKETWVLVKGGHFDSRGDDDVDIDMDGGQDQDQDRMAPQRQIIDVLVRNSTSASASASGKKEEQTGEQVEIHLLRKDYVDSRNTHGTGCSLASAIAANLAHRKTMVDAVTRASRYVESGIRSARDWRLDRDGVGTGAGAGSHGPIDHWATD